MKYSIKKYFSLRIISQLAAICLLYVANNCFVHAAQGVSVEQLSPQIQEIDATIKAFENELVQSNEKMSQISQDSANITTKNQAVLSDIQNKIRQIDQLITTKNSEITTVKDQRSKTARDSALAVQTFLTDQASLQSKIKQLEQLIAATSGEVALLSQKRAQLQQYSLLQADPQGIPLQVEKLKQDSVIAARQKMLKSLNDRKNQLIKDSTVQASILLAAKGKDEQVLQLVQSEIQNADVNVTSVKSSLDQLRAALVQKKSSVNDAAQKMISQKATLASSATQTIVRINKMEAELAQLRISAGELQKKYAEGRSPIATQLASISATIQTREKQKEIWLLMKEMFVVDSSISVKRNELDDLVQQVATGKKAAKKLVDEKEGELNVLLGKKDEYMLNPGVRQMSTEIASYTLAQRRARIEQVVTNIVQDIKKQTTLKLQTQQALAQYEAANPISADPSIQRYRQLDSLVAVERNQNEMIKAEIESINATIQSFKDSINSIDASARNEIGLYENKMNVAVVHRDSLVAKRDQIKKDALDARIKNNASFARLIGDLELINQKGIALEREISAAQGQLSDVQNRTIASRLKFEQTKASAIQEINLLDKQIAEKKNTSVESSNQSIQYGAQLKSLESNHMQTLALSTASLNSADNLISVKNGELQQLLNQRKSLVAQSDDVQKKQYNALFEIQSAGVSVQNRMATVKNEIRSLQSKRSQLLKIIQNNIANVFNSIDLTQREIDASNASYSEALQDSINFEHVRDSVYFQVKTQMERQESILASIKSQIQKASTELEQARSDSSNAVITASSVIYPQIQKIHSVDSMILIKEKELSALKAARIQAVQDSAAKAAGAQATVSQMQARVRQKSESFEALQLQSVVQQKEKDRMEAEARTKGEQFKNSRTAHAYKLNRTLGQIADKKQKLLQLQAELKNAEITLQTIQGNVSAPSPTLQSKSSVNSSSTAQAMIEKLYTMIGENRMEEARSLFISNKSQLQKYAVPEAVQMLESSF
jgi:hypothetical protein